MTSEITKQENKRNQVLSKTRQIVVAKDWGWIIDYIAARLGGHHFYTYRAVP